MSLIPQHRQEDLSVAYILAVAAKAGYNCGKLSMHDSCNSGVILHAA
jgi:hypothetical protein